VDLDPALFGQVGSGLIVPDLDLTFLARKPIYIFCNLMVQFVFGYIDIS
jgi:hypothetical protein